MDPSSEPLRYLSASDVETLLPAVEERLLLARRAMVALVADADLPPKIAVHPRPAASFAHAMPAWLRGADPAGRDDLLGLKWVAGFPGNARSGLPAIHGTVLLSDPLTGMVRAILDAGPITAHRTAAVSGICLGHWRSALEERDPGAVRVAVLGAGVQARAHLPVVAHLLPGAYLTIHDRHEERARALADVARALGSLGRVETAGTPQLAMAGADVVLTMVSFGPLRQHVPDSAFETSRLVIAVDYDMSVPAQVARSASLFATDERGQFLAARQEGIFRDYPDPAATIGEALLGGTPGAPPGGRVVVTHLGVGLADLVFADAIVGKAIERGAGIELPR
jgi:ornithine cyclodeaminase/alanine dehydrogenase-like protein (mu-crystallin family)